MERPCGWNWTDELDKELLYRRYELKQTLKEIGAEMAPKASALRRRLDKLEAPRVRAPYKYKPNICAMCKCEFTRELGESFKQFKHRTSCNQPSCHLRVLKPEPLQ